MDDAIRKELVYCLLMLQYNTDPMICAHYLLRLKQCYLTHQLEIPKDVERFIEKEAQRIHQELTPIYEQKKAELDALQRKAIKSPYPFE
ncbi:MAG: hypothetical protein QW594_01785 [Candidatus Woesearchaeota archaeon]